MTYLSFYSERDLSGITYDEEKRTLWLMTATVILNILG